ncbi:MAG: hypothetical protein LBG17_04940 [Bacteroidales bacterium]|jgi:hypothetical protein|nr:hypothetical protein [Bacteroidales bacterium]
MDITPGISIDTAIEAVATLLADRIKLSNKTTDTATKIRLEKEIQMLQRDRELIYGEGSKDDFNYVMDKVDTKYCPIIKNAFLTRTPIGNLL